MINLAAAWLNYCNKRNIVVPTARERCESLRLAITKCEYFEYELCKCQTWSTHMNHILNVKNPSDIHSLEIPIEYKVKYYFFYF